VTGGERKKRERIDEERRIEKKKVLIMGH